MNQLHLDTYMHTVQVPWTCGSRPTDFSLLEKHMAIGGGGVAFAFV